MGLMAAEDGEKKRCQDCEKVLTHRDDGQSYCRSCLRKRQDENEKRRKTDELEALKELPIEERVERIEKWIQGHTHEGLAPRQYKRG